MLIARNIALTAGLLAGCTPHRSEPRPAAAVSQGGAALAGACADHDGWSDPAPPARIHGNSWYVGTCGISVVLVTSAAGHVLIDGATAEAAPYILANIRALGFDPRDVRVIVGSHEHFDHMGGFAELKSATGAQLLAREPAGAALETGRTSPADPQAGTIVDMTPVAVDRVIGDGELVSVGDLALTAVATPGHTEGGTSWTWRSCADADCRTIVYADSMTAVSADGYRFTDHPERVAPFHRTFARVAALPCDILVTPHPGMSDLFARLGGQAPLVDAHACRDLAHDMEARLDQRLAWERKTTR